MIEALIVYLQEQCTDYTEVQHAWELEAVVDETTELPVMYVFPGDDNASNDGTEYRVSEKLVIKVHVQIACLHTELTNRKKQLRAAAIGWNPNQAEGYDDLALLSGKLINLKGGVAWWEDVYVTWVTARSVL